MSGFVKWAVVALAALFVGLAVLAFLGMFVATRQATKMVKEGPAAADLAAEITEYELPLNYEPRFGVEIMGTKMVTLEDASDPTAATYWLLESKEEAGDFDTLANTMASMTGAGAVDTSGLTKVSGRDLTIRGKPATITLREGPSAEGAGIREVQLEFEGKSGPAMLLVVGPAENWDQPSIDQFIQSLH